MPTIFAEISGGVPSSAGIGDFAVLPGEPGTAAAAAIIGGQRAVDVRDLRNITLVKVMLNCAGGLYSLNKYKNRYY